MLIENCSFLNFAGLTPNLFRNNRLNEARLSNPTSKQVSVTVLPCFSKYLARIILFSVRY